jgi:hypothetical protein
MLGRDTIKIGCALDLMRAAKVPFSIRFATCDSERKKKSRFIFLQRATQFASADVNWDNQTIDLKDYDSEKKIRVHKFLITDFNDKRVIL